MTALVAYNFSGEPSRTAQVPLSRRNRLLTPVRERCRREPQDRSLWPRISSLFPRSSSLPMTPAVSCDSIVSPLQGFAAPFMKRRKTRKVSRCWPECHERAIWGSVGCRGMPRIRLDRVSSGLAVLTQRRTRRKRLDQGSESNASSNG